MRIYRPDLEEKDLRLSPKERYQILDDRGNVIKTLTGRTLISHMKQDIAARTPLRYENGRCYQSRNKHSPDIYYGFQNTAAEPEPSTLTVAYAAITGRKKEVSDAIGPLDVHVTAQVGGDGLWWVSATCGKCFLPVLIESEIVPNPYYWSAHDTPEYYRIKVYLPSSTVNFDWMVLTDSVHVTFVFQMIEKEISCKVLLRKDFYAEGAGTYRFTDTEMICGSRVFRLFSPADIAKAMLLGSYDKVFKPIRNEEPEEPPVRQTDEKQE